MTTILPWLTNTEDVIGTADALGKDCKKLDKLYDHCWQIAGHVRMGQAAHQPMRSSS